MVRPTLVWRVEENQTKERLEGGRRCYQRGGKEEKRRIKSDFN